MTPYDDSDTKAQRGSRPAPSETQCGPRPTRSEAEAAVAHRVGQGQDDKTSPPTMVETSEKIAGGVEDIRPETHFFEAHQGKDHHRVAHNEPPHLHQVGGLLELRRGEISERH